MGMGLLVLAVVVVVVIGPSNQPKVSMGLVSWTSNAITFRITNSGPRAMCVPWLTWHAHLGSRLLGFPLAARSSTQMVASVSRRPGEEGRFDRVHLTCYPDRSAVGSLTDDLLRKLGCKVTNRFLILS